jgi:hypothetical protein
MEEVIYIFTIMWTIFIFALFTVFFAPELVERVSGLIEDWKLEREMKEVRRKREEECDKLKECIKEFLNESNYQDD